MDTQQPTGNAKHFHAARVEVSQTGAYTETMKQFDTLEEAQKHSDDDKAANPGTPMNSDGYGTEFNVVGPCWCGGRPV